MSDSRQHKSSHQWHAPALCRGVLVRRVGQLSSIRWMSCKNLAPLLFVERITLFWFGIIKIIRKRFLRSKEFFYSYKISFHHQINCRYIYLVYTNVGVKANVTKSEKVVLYSYMHPDNDHPILSEDRFIG